MKETQNPNSQVPKKPYSTPVLVEYGAVVKLTEGTGSRGNDGATHTKN
jgi:hypothetical protein